MADRLVSAPGLLFTKYKDMGDGSFAEVVYNGNVGGGGTAGASLSDVLLSDAAGVLFIARDSGTAITYARVDTGAAYTPSAPIKVAAASGAAIGTPTFAKLTDGTTAVVVTPQGSLSVSGQTAVGTAPATPPLAVSGVDGSGNKQHFKTDTNGVQQTNQAPYAITQTSVTVSTTSAQLIAANANRKYLSWMVIGTADVTIVPGATAAVAGAGLVYQASGAGKQGASEEFPNGAPSNAFQVIAAATGSTVIVWEGV
jgi:hypothetical protein